MVYITTYPNNTIAQKWLVVGYSAVKSKCYMMNTDNTGRYQTLK